MNDDIETEQSLESAREKESEEFNESNALFDLNPIEARILGCLMEKQLITPDQYPLTQNALLNACNQKSSREPVMNLEPGDVLHGLRVLTEKEWVIAEKGSRAERFKHRVNPILKITKVQQAVLMVMFLRGPQTLNELKVRTERALQGDEAAMLDALELLKCDEPPLVTVLPRQTGQREERYHQLVFQQSVDSASTTPSQVVEVKNLDESRLQKLEQQVAELFERIEKLDGNV